jgi:hypothetical protein
MHASVGLKAVGELWGGDLPTTGLWRFTEGIGIPRDSRAAQKMDFDVLALGFAPEFADQRESPAADRKVPAEMLDAAHLLECVFVEGRFVLHLGTIFAKQAESAVIPEHFRMHAGETGCVIE